MFNCQIVVDTKKIEKESANWKPLPVLANMIDDEGEDRLPQIVQDNYIGIKKEVEQIIKDETARIAADPLLCGLLVTDD